MTLISIRFNKKELQDLERVKKFFGTEKLYGANPQTIKKSLKFVLEFNQLVWERFLTDYPSLLREYVKKKLNEGDSK